VRPLRLWWKKDGRDVELGVGYDVSVPPRGTLLAFPCSHGSRWRVTDALVTLIMPDSPEMQAQTWQAGTPDELAPVEVFVVPVDGPFEDDESQDDEPKVWYEFHDGPWARARVQIAPSPTGREHLIPQRSTPGVGEWVPAGAAPGSARYVRTGSYGETLVMTWQRPNSGVSVRQNIGTVAPGSNVVGVHIDRL